MKGAQDSMSRKRRGGPLLVLGLVMVGWVGARASIWENPFPDLTRALPPLLAENRSGESDASMTTGPSSLEQMGSIHAQQRLTLKPGTSFAQVMAITGSRAPFVMASDPRQNGMSGTSASRSHLAMGHHMLWRAAMARAPQGLAARSGSAGRAFPPGLRAPPFAAPSNSQRGAGSKPDRWSLDGWAFWRQGAIPAPSPQGRVPIYGASQIGASLQYRLAPSNKRDPRLYTRAYRALVSDGVSDGESELALGGSIKPVAGLPVRAYAEARVTFAPDGTQLRPGTFVATELAPQTLPGGIIAEAYGQGGYIGGDAATAFADGQVSITRELKRFDLSDTKKARFSVGAGTWGGVQRDASRVDIGPTIRLDLTIGTVPARISVDWREQVAGDAVPDSGIAATVSTRF